MCTDDIFCRTKEIGYLSVSETHSLGMLDEVEIGIFNRSCCFESMMCLHDIVNLVQVPLEKKRNFLVCKKSLLKTYLVNLCEVMNLVDRVISFEHGIGNRE